jgi:hypothetical protein
VVLLVRVGRWRLDAAALAARPITDLPFAAGTASAGVNTAISTEKYSDTATYDAVLSGSVVEQTVGDFDSSSTTCPVSCAWDGSAIHVQHYTGHVAQGVTKLGTQANPMPSGAQFENDYYVNKLFHRCFHRATGTNTPALAYTKPEGVAGKDLTMSNRSCQCQCASWQFASGTCGEKVCKFHNKVLDDNKCLGDKPADVEC